MSDTAGIRVRVWYPDGTKPDDETWLATFVSCHHGELSERLLESFPPRRDAWFESRSDMGAFVAALAGSGRWRV